MNIEIILFGKKLNGNMLKTLHSIITLLEIQK